MSARVFVPGLLLNLLARLMAAGAVAEAVVGPAGQWGPFLHTLEPKQMEYSTYSRLQMDLGLWEKLGHF